MAKKIICVVTIALLAIFFVSFNYGDEKKGSIEKKSTGEEMNRAGRFQKPLEEWTKEELAEEIKEAIDSEDEVLDFIPDLKKQKDTTGKGFYTYKGKRLEEIDKETLRKILGTVQNQAVMIRTNRIQRQLEAVRQAQRITAGPPQIPTPVVQPQRPPSQVTPPKIPPIPPTPPKR